LYTCSDEFLEQQPQAAFSEAALQNQAGVEAALIAAYSRLDGWADDWGNADPWGTAASNWVFGEVTADNTLKGSEASDQPDVGLVELYQWQPNNGMFRAKFNVLFDGIFRANKAIELLASATDISDADRDRITGEATFLRAHFYFEAWRMWENVPYFKEFETDFRRANDQDILPELFTDFQTAERLLPDNQSDVGRATKLAATAYLGKLYLYNRDWTNAKQKLDQVVNSNRFELNPCYRDMFTVDGESGPEMIFSIQASVNDGSSESQNGNFGDRLTFPHAGSPIGCCGFNQPTQNWVNAHLVDENGLPLFEDWNTLNENPSPETLVDPRLDWNVARFGVPYLDWGVVPDATWIRDIANQNQYSAKKMHYSGQAQSSNVGWSNRQLNPINVPVIRYADVLLMLAEAEAELGNLERARELVNMIRMRAGNCAQGPLPDGGKVAIDDPGITWATYRVGTYDETWTDQQAALDAIERERRLELGSEAGHRFFDLKRRGEMIETVTEYLAVERTRVLGLQAAQDPTEKNMLFPLPTEAIDLSAVDGVPQLRQNPGY
jgi:hypothetical protein